VTQSTFPIGGSRQAVYDALRVRGFVLSNWTDKWWNRRDGLEVHVYGSGSRLSVHRDKEQVTDGLMADSLARIDEMDRELSECRGK
jgi:glycerophosphoryl diester phosphodiesterase